MMPQVQADADKRKKSGKSADVKAGGGNGNLPAESRKVWRPTAATLLP
jgi:hypothetical protein